MKKKYRVWCETDNKWEDVKDTIEPSGCPINPAHTIDSIKTTITHSYGEVLIRRDAWDINTEYFEDDLVDYENGCFICLNQTSGTLPIDINNWMPLSVVKRRETVRFNILGNLVAGDAQDGLWVSNYDAEIISTRSIVQVAGLDGNILIDVNINGNSIYQSQNDRIDLPAASGNFYMANGGAIASGLLQKGDWICVDIDEKHSGNSKDVTVIIELEY
jgi:hypothetical protein